MSGDNFGIHRVTGTSTTRPSTQDDRSQGQILSDFLLQLEDYTPTVRFFFILFVIYFY